MVMGISILHLRCDAKSPQQHGNDDDTMVVVAVSLLDKLRARQGKM
jgi:hypothetical protein